MINKCLLKTMNPIVVTKIFFSNLDEYWWIHNPNHGSNDLVIEILEIDVEKAPDCKYDRLIIYQGDPTLIIILIIIQIIAENL